MDNNIQHVDKAEASAAASNGGKTSKRIKLGLLLIVLIGGATLTIAIPQATDAVITTSGMPCFQQMRLRSSICKIYRALRVNCSDKLYSHQLLETAQTKMRAEANANNLPQANRYAQAIAEYLDLSQPLSNAEAVILYQWSEMDIAAGDYNAARRVLEHYVDRFGPPESPSGNVNLYAYALANLGNFHGLQGKSREALMRKLQASQLWERDPVANAVPLARVNNEAASLCELVLHDAESAKLLRKAALHYEALAGQSAQVEK